MQKKPKIKLDDDDFGAVLNCAVRYAIGRHTYMPGIVIDVISPLIPFLNDKTLWCFDQDTSDAMHHNDLGDPDIDAPEWLKFRETVREERNRRGHDLYEIPWKKLGGQQ